MTKLMQSSLTACIVLAGVAGTQTLRAPDREHSWFDATTPGAYFQLAGLSPTSYMGVNLADIDSDRAKTLKLRDVHGVEIDGKSTRLNSSHLVISYAVFCLKKKNHS